MFNHVEQQRKPALMDSDRRLHAHLKNRRHRLIGPLGLNPTQFTEDMRGQLQTDEPTTMHAFLPLQQDAGLTKMMDGTKNSY